MQQEFERVSVWMRERPVCVLREERTDCFSWQPKNIWNSETADWLSVLADANQSISFRERAAKRAQNTDWVIATISVGLGSQWTVCLQHACAVIPPFARLDRQDMDAESSCYVRQFFILKRSLSLVVLESCRQVGRQVHTRNVNEAMSV